MSVSLGYSCCVVFAASGLLLLKQPLLMTCTSVFTSQQLLPSLPDISVPPFLVLRVRNQTHTCIYTLPCTFFFLFFKQHKPCWLIWTFRSLKSFKISLNYRPCKTGETFFLNCNYSFFVGSILRSEPHEQYLSLKAEEMGLSKVRKPICPFSLPSSLITGGKYKGLAERRMNGGSW